MIKIQQNASWYIQVNTLLFLACFDNTHQSINIDYIPKTLSYYLCKQNIIIGIHNQVIKLKPSFKMTDLQNGRWFALQRIAAMSQSTKNNKQMSSNKQKPHHYKDFEFNIGQSIKNIKFVSDQKSINDANRYPELICESYPLFKSLNDRQVMTLHQKKQYREKIRRRLNEKQNSQIQATARFETENPESKSDCNNVSSPEIKTFNIHQDVSLTKSTNRDQPHFLDTQMAQNSSMLNTSSPGKHSKGPPNNLIKNNSNNRVERQERSSNNDIIGDRDFSIATSSVQSSVLKSTKFLADKAQIRGENQASTSGQTREQGYRRKVTIDESKSTPKDSSSQREQTENAAASSEPAVQYRKKDTIRRFSTLKNEDNYQAAQRLTKKQLPEGDSDHRAKKNKIKRGKTQKGDPGKAFPAESSDNGITLCKISESCLEELSIVESEDLYGSEAPNAKQKEYDERIQRKIQEGKQFMESKGRFLVNQSHVNAGGDKKSEKSRKKAFVSKSNEPRKLQEMNKNETNTQQKVFFKKMNQQKQGPASDFISIGSSSEFGMGRQSNLGMKYGRSKEKLSIKSRGMRDRRDSSSFLDSNYSSQSGALSIGKSQGSYNVNNRTKKTISQTRDHHQNAKGPSDGQSITSSNNTRSLPRNSEGFLSHEHSPLVAQSQKQKFQNNGISGTRPRGQSLNPKQNKTLPKLPGFKLQHKRDQPKKKKVLSKELAQVTEKDEYDYSPMKSNVTQENLNFELAVKRHKQQNKSKDFQELDKELLANQDKTGNVKFEDSQGPRNRHGSEYNLKKVHSIEDTESHQFEDSLLEQSSPNADGKDMPYGDDRASMHDTTNIQLCNASGSYHVQQMTISSQGNKNQTTPMAKKKIVRRKKKSPQKVMQPKDGNFKNIREYAMFIPNQPSVSQVQGKTKVYLAVSDAGGRELNTSVSKSSARRLAQQTDLQSLIFPRREQLSHLRSQMCNSMTGSHQVSKKVSPALPREQRPHPKATKTPIHRSQIQPQKTDESGLSYNTNDNLTDRQTTRPKYHKMLTQKANASRIDQYHPTQSTIKKQKTQHVTDKERQASDHGKAPKGAQETLNQIMFAQQRVNDANLERYMKQHLVRNDKSRSQLKSKKAVSGVAKQSAPRNSKVRRTDEPWRPWLLQDAQTDGDVGYLESIAAIGNEPDHNISPEPKIDAQDQAQAHQGYSSVHSSARANRKSMDSLSNKQKRVPPENKLFFHGVKSVMNNHSFKSPPTACRWVTDLPQVAKQNYSVPKRQKQTATKYAANQMLPGPLMPSIDHQRKLQRSPRGRSHQSSQINTALKQNNREILSIIRGLCNGTQHSRASGLERHATDGASAGEAAPGGVIYYNDLFTGELRLRQRTDTKFMPKIEVHRRRIGSYGQANMPDTHSGQKQSTELEHQSKALASGQQAANKNTEPGRAAKQVATITKLSPQRTRAAGAKQAGASNARYAGDPYAIPLHYLRPNAPEPRAAHRTQAKFAYKFHPKPIRGSGGSPFHASGGSHFQASGGSHVPPQPDTITGLYTAHRSVLHQDSKEGTFAEFGQAIIAGADTTKGHLLSGSLVIPSNMSKASGPSSRQQRKLRPLEGTDKDKDKGLQAKQLQPVGGTFSGANELSMSPSSRHSRRIHLNQSIDQCYFNPELSHLIMNSSVAIVRNASQETEEDEAKKKQQQSQLMASRDGRGPVVPRGPLAPDGRATLLQGRQDMPEHLRLQQQQQISLYFNHICSQRSRTSQQNSRRNMIRPDGRGGVEGVSSSFVNSSQAPIILATNTDTNKSRPHADGLGSPQTHENPILSENEHPGLVDYVKHLPQNDSSDKIQRMQQQIQRMNLSELRLEMLTSNRSWRSGVGRATAAHLGATVGGNKTTTSKGSKVYINRQNHAHHQ